MDLKQLLNQTTIGKSELTQTVDTENTLDTEDTTDPADKSDTADTADSELNPNLSNSDTKEPSENDPEEQESDTEPSVDPRFSHPWNKLVKGSKMNRILLYVEQETQDKSLSDTQAQELKKLLFRGCESGCFNKISDVKYNPDTGIIESFKQLEFNESSKKYKLKTGGTKTRSVSKSRSNIDRLMKKK